MTTGMAPLSDLFMKWMNHSYCGHIFKENLKMPSDHAPLDTKRIPSHVKMSFSRGSMYNPRRSFRIRSSSLYCFDNSIIREKETSCAVAIVGLAIWRRKQCEARRRMNEWWFSPGSVPSLVSKNLR